MVEIKILKKDGSKENYDKSKIVNAVTKSAERVMICLSEDDWNGIISEIESKLCETQLNEISIHDMHKIVELSLDKTFPDVAKSYRDYRNYKQDFVNIMDDVFKSSQRIRYLGDKSNANTDSALVPTQRSLIYGELNGELYKKFFLNQIEREAMKDGYIYIHDRKDRLDTFNCCLWDMANVISGGFEMGNVWYNEPKTLDVAFDVISDVTISAAAMQYGGFTIPRVDTVLAPYAEKSYQKYKEEFYNFCDNPTEEKADKYATSKVYRDMEQGFQSWEYRFNTVGSSRGDYPFISISFGIGQSKWETMASSVIMKVRANGQGAPGRKKPVLFPKLTFLYDENLHGEGNSLEWLFDEAIECSSKAMYPKRRIGA